MCSIGASNAIRAALYIEALGQSFLEEDLFDPPGYFLNAARDINESGWIAGGTAGAALLKRTGDMPPPTPPANLTAVPHFPTERVAGKVVVAAAETRRSRSSTSSGV